MELPTCNPLFREYFAGWYSKEETERRADRETRPDIETLGLTLEQVKEQSPVTADVGLGVAQRIAAMLDAARKDWKGLLKVTGEPSMEWLSAFDAHFDKQEILDLIIASSPEEFGNDYLVLCCEAGAVLGAVLQEAEPRLQWVYDSPYWESALYDEQTGTQLNVFHWVIRRMSDPGLDDGLADRVRRYVGLIRQG
ncbi:MAG: hypothetical protein ABI158_05745 [Edaphobacter sp.]